MRRAAPSRVRLEVPAPRHEARFLEAALKSRRHLGRWAAAPSTRAAYRAYLRRVRRPTHRGYLIVLRGTAELVGVVNISEIVRGAFRSAYLGYYGFAPHAGRGLMTEGVGLAVARAFGPLRLHRLEANIQPGNPRSRALARRLGFRREGFSPRYLEIFGRWRDHERWALCVEDARGARAVLRRRRGGAAGSR